jgi:pimeloyl-ACP methyl ester carboxylesterase
MNQASRTVMPLVSQKARRTVSLAVPLAILVALVSAIACLAQDAPAPRNVDLSASDGTKLKATYFAASKPGPGVLLLHQCNQQRHSWDAVAARLAASGIHVLTLDYRGYGESGGTPYKDLPPGEPGRLELEKWPGDVDVAFAY